MVKIVTHTGTAEREVVPREDWLVARKALLREEKELFRLHDRLKERRRKLPWVKIGKDYTFDGPDGRETLVDLFDGKSQLLIYHFMFNPANEAGCAHCSFWADHYDGVRWHIGQRDTAFVAVSRAPLKKIRAFKKRMGWKFKWLSSAGSDFNFDFQASFSPAQIASGAAMFNYAKVDHGMTGMSDREGVSAFFRDKTGAIYHTYSTWARGIDLLNTTYNFLDLTAKGRDEDPQAPQDWVRHHDKYRSSGASMPPKRRRASGSSA
jgi:predicted dithiol-disulfide oxidoreductase (DUF899 family)